jgi:hypothetical protein
MAKNILTYLEPSNSAKTTKCALWVGRAQPWHVGHDNMVKVGLKNAETVFVVLVRGKQSSQDKEKNPLDFQTQKDLINSIYPADKVIVSDESPPSADLNDLMPLLYNKNMEAVAWLQGEDRADSYEGLFSYFKYPEWKQTHDYIPIKPSIEFVVTPRVASATDAREAAKSTEFIEWLNKFAPPNVNQTARAIYKKAYDQIRGPQDTEVKKTIQEMFTKNPLDEVDMVKDIHNNKFFSPKASSTNTGNPVKKNFDSFIFSCFGVQKNLSEYEFQLVDATSEKTEDYFKKNNIPLDAEIPLDLIKSKNTNKDEYFHSSGENISVKNTHHHITLRFRLYHLGIFTKDGIFNFFKKRNTLNSIDFGLDDKPKDTQRIDPTSDIIKKEVFNNIFNSFRDESKQEGVYDSGIYLEELKRTIINSGELSSPSKSNLKNLLLYLVDDIGNISGNKVNNTTKLITNENNIPAIRDYFGELLAPIAFLTEKNTIGKKSSDYFTAIKYDPAPTKGTIKLSSSKSEPLFDSNIIFEKGRVNISSKGGEEGASASLTNLTNKIYGKLPKPEGGIKTKIRMQPNISISSELEYILWIIHSESQRDAPRIICDKFNLLKTIKTMRPAFRLDPSVLVKSVLSIDEIRSLAHYVEEFVNTKFKDELFKICREKLESLFWVQIYFKPVFQKIRDTDNVELTSYAFNMVYPTILEGCQLDASKPYGEKGTIKGKMCFAVQFKKD